MDFEKGDRQQVFVCSRCHRKNYSGSCRHCESGWTDKADRLRPIEPDVDDRLFEAFLSLATALDDWVSDDDDNKDTDIVKWATLAIDAILQRNAPADPTHFLSRGQNAELHAITESRGIDSRVYNRIRR